METPKHTIDNRHIATILHAAHGGGVCGRDRESLIAAASAFSDLLAAVNALLSVGITIDARLDVANTESMVKDNSGNRVYLAATCHKLLKAALWQARAAIALAEKE